MVYAISWIGARLWRRFSFGTDTLYFEAAFHFAVNVGIAASVFFLY